MAGSLDDTLLTWAESFTGLHLREQRATTGSGGTARPDAAAALTM
jgi:hypothetical protein